jgi:phosphatidyl-myo-inositol dimannoside synthase
VVGGDAGAHGGTDGYGGVAVSAGAKTRILIASADYTPDGGGIGAYAHGLWQGLTRLGSRARVLSRLTPARRASGSERMVPIETGGTFRRNVGALGSWYSALVREQCDWIVIPTWDPVAMAATVPLFRGAVSGRIAVIFHGSDVASASGRKARLLNHVMRSSDRLIANSRFTCELIEQRYGLKSETVWPAIGEDDLAVPQEDRLTLEVISVGRLVPRKGHVLAIGAVARLAGEYPGLHYTIVGDGPERAKLEELAGSLGVAERIVFLGEVSDEEKRRRLAAASVFVLPVRGDPADPEGYGIAYLEAGAARLPVLATRTGGVAECVREGESGLFCDASVPGVESSLRLLLDNPELRHRLGDGGRAVAESSRWSDRARDLLDILEAE